MRKKKIIIKISPEDVEKIANGIEVHNVQCDMYIVIRLTPEGLETYEERLRRKGH